MKRMNKITALILSFMMCVGFMVQGSIVFAAEEESDNGISSEMKADSESFTEEKINTEEVNAEEKTSGNQSKEEKESTTKIDKNKGTEADKKVKSISNVKKARSSKAVKTVGGTSLSDWDYTDNGSEVILNKYNYKGTPTDVVIPSTIEGKTVKIKSLEYGELFPFKADIKSLKIGDPLNKVKIQNGSMNCAFEIFSNLESIDLSGLDTSSVTNMGSMFSECKSLSSLDVSNFKTDNVTDMMGMFSGCSSLSSLDVSKFKTDNVTDMSYMFNECSNLESLDVSHFKTDNVILMSYMFSECSSLKRLDVSKFKTDNVTHMIRMFIGCNNLTFIDISSFSISDTTNIKSMFELDPSMNVKTVIISKDKRVKAEYGDNIPRRYKFDAINYNANGGAFEDGTSDDKTYFGTSSYFFDSKDELTPTKRMIEKRYTTTREGYAFTGWYTDADCKTKFVGDDTKVDLISDVAVGMTLYAGWKTADKDDNTGSNDGKDNIKDNVSKDVTVSSDKEAKVSTVTPKTGDSENMALYGGIALLSIIGLGIGAGVLFKRKYTNR